jgi:hypothetical protein
VLRGREVHNGAPNRENDIQERRHHCHRQECRRKLSLSCTPNLQHTRPKDSNTPQLPPQPPRREEVWCSHGRYHDATGELRHWGHPVQTSRLHHHDDANSAEQSRKTSRTGASRIGTPDPPTTGSGLPCFSPLPERGAGRRHRLAQDGPRGGADRLYIRADLFVVYFSIFRIISLMKQKVSIGSETIFTFVNAKTWQ